MSEQPAGSQTLKFRMDPDLVDRIVSSWPSRPQEVARKTIGAFGDPDEATPSALLWHDRGFWKRTIVYRTQVRHNFPRPHVDVLEQFIDYRVPIDRLAELARFNGSVIVERTRGEMSARCDMEESNFLALNLADEIVIGERTAASARELYRQTTADLRAGKRSPYVTGLRFEVVRPTADPDVPLEQAESGSS
jgi:hypothetical protein